MTEQIPLPCAYCNRSFAMTRSQFARLLYGPFPTHGFCCSRRCAALVSHPTPNPVMVACANCGKLFIASRDQRQKWKNKPLEHGPCCSPSCRVLVRRNKNRSMTAAHLARHILEKAIAAGRLVRPEACERCGSNPGLDRAGKTKIYGHHHNYNKPLEVEWVCVRCHNTEVHPPLRGSASPRAILTETDIPVIRAMLAKGVFHREIALRFNVTKSVISHISDGTTWRHVHG